VQRLIAVMLKAYAASEQDAAVKQAMQALLAGAKI
jgi:hypothetical protein